MGKLRVVIVDDETLLLEQMEAIFEDCEKAEIVGIFSNAYEALIGIKSLRPDVVFLDVSMPGMDGFQLDEKIRSLGLDSFHVFVTGHKEYALRAFDAEATDYIVKPFTKERVVRSLERLEKRARVQKEKTPVNAMPRNWIPADEKGGIRLIPLEDVYYVVADGKSTRVFSRDGDWLTELTLAAIEEQYRYKMLFRCHKSFIVNIAYIERVDPMFNQNYIIHLKGIRDKIPVSRHYAKAMKECLGISK